MSQRRGLNPLVCIEISSLERMAVLVEKGMPVAKAMRQVAAELREYDAMFQGQNFPTDSFAEKLGVPQRKVA